MTVDPVDVCARCGTALDEYGYCGDETCPFSDHLQSCAAGWSGHPIMDPIPEDDTAVLRCVCAAK